MSAVCPAGHPSTSHDYCDVCGLKIGAAPGAAPASGPEPAAEAEGTRVCPNCGWINRADAHFCEQDGYDLDAVPILTQPSVPIVTRPSNHPSDPDRPTEPPEPPPPDVWEAVATADREYFDRIEAPGVEFPARPPVRRFILEDDEVHIGRHSRSKGLEPAIDLSAAPEDEAISHNHAVLVRQPDGGWCLIDPGSTNGVYVDGQPEPVARNQEIPVHDGTVLRLGAWTSITIRRVSGDQTAPAPTGRVGVKVTGIDS